LGRIRRGGYIVLAWESDHQPRRVHVHRDGRFVVKWDLENRRPIVGEAPRRVIDLIGELESEGLL